MVGSQRNGNFFHFAYPQRRDDKVLIGQTITISRLTLPTRHNLSRFMVNSIRPVLTVNCGTKEEACTDTQ
jgi:hypothetical protein